MILAQFLALLGGFTLLLATSATVGMMLAMGKKKHKKTWTQ